MFARWRRDDPVMSALFDGTMLWGDIPGICDSPVVSKFSTVLAPSELFTASVHKLSTASVARVASAATSTPQRMDGLKTLVVRNIPRDVSVQRLSNVFGKYGPIDDIYIPRNRDHTSTYYNTIKGFAFIKFVNHEHAADAYLLECGDALGPNKITIEFANRDR